MAVDQSILNNVKKILGIEQSYTAFDTDVIIHTNSVFSKLNQLGIGPEDGFEIEDDTAVWASFIGTNRKYNFVKTYVYLSVRLLFDPPTGAAYLIESTKEQIKELEWRLNILREETEWVDPTSTIDDADDLVLDGGHP